MRNRKPWTAREITYLRENTHVTNKEISKILGRTEISVAKAGMRHGIRKTHNYLFVKGEKSWNSGVKGSNRPNETSFKKGLVPHNFCPVGSIKERSRGNGVKRKFIKVSRTKWMLLSHYNWINEHGPIPKGFVLHYRDGDQGNADLCNLSLIRKRDLVRKNMNTKKAQETRDKNFARLRLLKKYGIPTDSKLSEILRVY